MAMLDDGTSTFARGMVTQTAPYSELPCHWDYIPYMADVGVAWVRRTIYYAVIAPPPPPPPQSVATCTDLNLMMMSTLDTPTD